MYIIRSNIFKPGTDSQRHFERYKIQVSVVHRPDDFEFNAFLQSIDLHLHRLTGEYVAFFPFIDPSEEWLESIKGSPFSNWWGYQQQYGMPFDNILTQQVADFFGLNWDDLPSLVISPSLWNGNFVTIKTSVDLIEHQFEVLTGLSYEKDKIEIHDIAQIIAERFDEELPIKSSDMRFLASFYEFLETYNRIENRFDRSYWKMIVKEFDSIRSVLADNRNIEQNKAKDEVEIENSINRTRKALVAPASVASRAYGFPSPDLSRFIPGFNGLEADSKLMIETSELVGWYLGFMNQRNNPGLRLDDFTPGAQGYWKSLELEINLSLIQAARLARGIEMPEYFTLYKYGIPSQITLVTTPRRPHNLNVLDNQASKPGRHKFLMLGDSYYVIQTMLNDSHETLDDLIFRYIGEPLPSRLMEVWALIRDMRNKGSHINPLSETDFHLVRDSFSESAIFQPLARLKTLLR